MDNKQWETEGRCPKCERKDTCKKACDAHKKRVRGEIPKERVDVSDT